MMNVEELREYCLSLSGDVTEKFPFVKFRGAADVLAFYIGGHIFCYFDINDPAHVTVKCPKDTIPVLLEQYDCLDHPYNGSHKYWVGIDLTRAERSLVEKLVQQSFRLVGKIK